MINNGTVGKILGLFDIYLEIRKFNNLITSNIFNRVKCINYSNIKKTLFSP
jgi:hypothetical protein